MGKQRKKKGGAEARRAKHERREAARKARQNQRRLIQQSGPSNLPCRFANDYGSAILQNCGPQILCTWSIPRAMADAMQQAGRAVPAPIQGAILLDTGATRTCIALKTAIDLGLQPTRMQDGLGASGKYSNPVFLAHLAIRIGNPKTGTVSGFEWEQEVEGIPELHNFAAPMVWQGQTMIVTGLLGRDILRHAKIYYDGPSGRLRFEFDVASLQQQPSR